MQLNSSYAHFSNFKLSVIAYLSDNDKNCIVTPLKFLYIISNMKFMNVTR